MIEVMFAGWFQCRLATDPDPYDEPRGVSGYVHAYAGEPDLDRILHFQKPQFTRTLGPEIGVSVREVRRDGQAVPNHPLLDAAVSLRDSPTFEGRNGVVAEDGFEPIYPFVLDLSAADASVVRAVAPEDPLSPFDGLFAGGVELGQQEVTAASGIGDLLPIWRDRLGRLRADLDTLDEPQLSATQERIEFLDRNLAGGGGAARFFGALMRYDYELNSVPDLHDPNSQLASIDSSAPWRATFWLGGWDADILCGYANGLVRMPELHDPKVRDRRLSHSTDRRP